LSSPEKEQPGCKEEGCARQICTLLEENPEAGFLEVRIEPKFSTKFT
jgi:hypothetical protein